MGLLDDFKSKGAELKDKAEEAIAANSDKIDAGLDKAAGAVSKATKGKYDHQIDKASSKAKAGLDKIADDKGPGTAGPKA